MKTFQSSLQSRAVVFRGRYGAQLPSQVVLRPDCECKGTATFESTQGFCGKSAEYLYFGAILRGQSWQNGEIRGDNEGKGTREEGGGRRERRTENHLQIAHMEAEGGKRLKV